MNEDALGEVYRRICGLSLFDQRQVLGSLSSDDRAALWRRHLQDVLERYSPLTDEQQAIVQDGIQLLGNPRWFDIRAGDPDWEAKSERFALHKQRAEAAFSPLMVYRVFMRIGRDPQDVDDRTTNPP